MILDRFWKIEITFWICLMLLWNYEYNCINKNNNLLICPGLNNEEYQVVIGNDTTRFIIDDLEPARNYTFYVVAYMPMGASRMSDHMFQHTLEDGEACPQWKL